MSEYYYEPDIYLNEEAVNRDKILKNVSDPPMFQIPTLMPSPQDFIHNNVDITLGLPSRPVQLQNLEKISTNRNNIIVPQKKSVRKTIKTLSPINDVNMNDFHLDGNILNGTSFFENSKKNDETSNNNFISNFFSNFSSNESVPMEHNPLQPANQVAFLEENKEKENFLKSIRTYDHISKTYLSNMDQTETRLTQEESEIISESESDLMFSDTDCIDIFTNRYLSSQHENEVNFFKMNENVKMEEFEERGKNDLFFFDFTKFDPFQKIAYQRKKIETIIAKLNELASPSRNQIFSCKICGKNFDNYFTLGGHVSRCMKLNTKSEILKPTKSIQKQKNPKVSKFFL